MASPRIVGEKFNMEPTDRISVVANVVHTSNDEGLTDFQVRFGRPLKTREQPFLRKMKLTEEWQPLDTGWLDGCSMLCIDNRVGEEGQYIRKEPLNLDVGGMVELSYTKDSSQSFLIPPREAYFVIPSNVKGLFIRCRSGNANVLLELLPE